MSNELIKLALSFGKIGLISLGGGNSMLKLIEFEAINNRHWIAQDEFIRMTGTSFLFPGLTAVKLSALIGYKVAGIIGLLLAFLAINLPGLFLAIIGYKLLNNTNNPLIHKIMIPVQYGALALLVAASFSIAQGVIETYYSPPILIMTFIFCIALLYFKLSPFWGFLGFIGICSFFVK